MFSYLSSFVYGSDVTKTNLQQDPRDVKNDEYIILENKDSLKDSSKDSHKLHESYLTTYRDWVNDNNDNCLDSSLAIFAAIFGELEILKKSR